MNKLVECTPSPDTPLVGILSFIFILLFRSLQTGFSRLEVSMVVCLAGAVCFGELSSVMHTTGNYIQRNILIICIINLFCYQLLIYFLTTKKKNNHISSQFSISIYSKIIIICILSNEENHELISSLLHL